jgi:YbbR domain-containing protein
MMLVKNHQMKDRFKYFVNNFKGFITGIGHPWRGKQGKAIYGIDRKRIATFIICLFLAFILWMIVNLDRIYRINLRIPLALGKVTTKKVLAEKLPSAIMASVSGRGWDLIKMYNHPPRIYVDITGKQVNLFQQVRQQTSSNITVQKVEPFYLQPKLEPRVSKRVPVKPNVDVHFAKQYDFIQKPTIIPDSVTVQGASSQVDDIHYWPTDSLTYKNVKKNIYTQVRLKEPNSLIQLSNVKVSYQATVVQFTEGEVKVPVEKRDFPMATVVSFDPSSVTVKYRVPLQEYGKFSEGQPFEAYVTYAQFKKDSTGFLVPQIETRPQKAHLKVRAVQPKVISYFTIIGQRGDK